MCIYVYKYIYIYLYMYINLYIYIYNSGYFSSARNHHKTSVTSIAPSLHLDHPTDVAIALSLFHSRFDYCPSRYRSLSFSLYIISH